MTLKREDPARVVQTQIKNPDLVERRRRQIVEAVVPLLVKNGFHKTTTRQISKAAGFSIGTLYEYVACKEDVLYLVCEDIHDQIERRIGAVLSRVQKGREALAAMVREFFLTSHQMSDVYLLMYQETHALPPQWREKVLENELRINELIHQGLKRIAESGDLGDLDEDALKLLSHNISVMAHMWTFRRWVLSKEFTIEEYIARQTEYILKMVPEKK
jgi:AcrR family transcriptional regulator